MNLMAHVVEDIYKDGKSVLDIGGLKQSIVFEANSNDNGLDIKVINHFEDYDDIFDIDKDEMPAYVAFLVYYSINSKKRTNNCVSLTAEENDSSKEGRIFAINELYNCLLPMISINSNNIESVCKCLGEDFLLYEYFSNIKNNFSSCSVSLSVYDIINSLLTNFSKFSNLVFMGYKCFNNIGESSSDIEYHEAVCEWNDFMHHVFMYELAENKENNFNIAELDKLGIYYDLLTNKSYDSNPVVDCDEEIKKLQIALLTRSKSALLVGPPGVGKTAIVEGLAYLIKTKQASKALQNKKILKINPSSIVSGCSYVGQLEAKVESLMKYLVKNNDVILYLDEMHTVIGGGSGEASNMDLANLIKPYIERGQVKIIGATTTNEYNEYIQSDEAFNRRFIRVKIDEPKEKTIYKILSSHIPNLERLTNVSWNFNINDSSIIINQLIDVTKEKNRVYNDKQYNPDISLSILEKAFAIALLEDCQTVEIENVAQAIKSTECLYESPRERSANNLLRRLSTRNTTCTNIIAFPNSYTKKNH